MDPVPTLRSLRIGAGAAARVNRSRSGLAPRAVIGRMWNEHGMEAAMDE